MAALQLVPARYYARLCDVVKNLGHDPTSLVRAAGIVRREIQSPEGMLTMQQVEALLAAARRMTGRTDLGLELAQALQLTSHSVVSYGMLSSPTLGYCLRLVARYFSLIMPSFRMDYGCDDEQMRITVEPVWPMSRACLSFHLEVIAACVHREALELLRGEMPVHRLYFSIDRPPHAHRYDAFRGLRTEFGWRARPGFRIEWPAAVAAAALTMSEPHALRLAEQRCNDMTEKTASTGHVASWIRMMLREASGGPPSQLELANILNLSARTLDRYLKKEGVSFRQLNRDARRVRACDLLREGRLSITQIAYELGYTDVSNFARAFRREIGCSPAEWQTGYTGLDTADQV